MADMPALDFSKPFKAMVANADLTITPWALISLLSAAASNLLTPLAPVAGWAFVVCLSAAVATFFLAARSKASDPQANPLRLYGNGLLVAVVLGLGFGSVWTWQQIAGNPQQGVIVAKAPELAPLQNLLPGMVIDLHALRDSAASADAGIERINRSVKRETSEDPRKELANMGLPWTAESFLKSIELGDRRSIDLYLAGGMRPDVRTDQSVLFYAIVSNSPDLEWTLRRFVQMGLDLDQPMDLHDGSYALYPSAQWKTPVYVAAMHGRFATLRLLMRLGATTKPMAHEFSALVAQIDAAEAEKVRMRDPKYCAAKKLREKFGEVVEMAKKFCLVDFEACADSVDPNRGYRHTAMLVCEKMVPLERQFAPLNWSPTNPTQRKSYVQALEALGQDPGQTSQIQ
ncbi:hypothetical protein [Magnetospirillum sp. 15-1]|uniref:hypothetical protein n=1 Tax=Magnetospirillum sp. 15-1 TaxID=1979370 RepID=UPI0011437F54|nr:hypothetical protein [Magnetospirillum sp. 15-1]